MEDNSFFLKKFCPEKVFYQVKDGENLQILMSKFNLPISAFECRQFEAGDVIVIDFSPQIIHVVKPAQTIFDIAKIYDKEPNYLLQKNGCDTIFVGQKLII